LTSLRDGPEGVAARDGGAQKTTKSLQALLAMA